MPQDAAQGGGEDVFQQAAVYTLLQKKTPSERIVFLRREKKMSQEDLADAVDAAGVPSSGRWKVWRWEHGMRPRGPARAALAAVLGVPETVLFD
jgi:DNA-binding transcriptional regulator YiaG